MDQDAFTKLVATLHHLQVSAGEVAGFVVAPLLLSGAICGWFLTRWIFRGGLSRGAFRATGLTAIHPTHFARRRIR